MESDKTQSIGVNEAAKLLGVSVATVRKWVLIREVPFYKLGSRVVLDRDEILKWRNRHRVEAIV